MTMTITVPKGLEALGESVKALLEELGKSMHVAALKRTPRYSDVEGRIADRTAEIEREANRAMLHVTGFKYRMITISSVRAPSLRLGDVGHLLASYVGLS